MTNPLASAADTSSTSSYQGAEHAQTSSAPQQVSSYATSALGSGATVVVRAIRGSHVVVPYSVERDRVRRENLAANNAVAEAKPSTSGTR
jgi:hypothetical protein